jgi:type I restriction enzyme S subunit
MQNYEAFMVNKMSRRSYLLFWRRVNMDGIKGRANGSTFMEISKKAQSQV